MHNYIANVIPHLQQWWPVIFVLAYLAGVILAIIAFAQSISHKHKYTRSTALWTFFAAVLLLNLPAFMDSLSMTVFNSSSEKALSYSPPVHPLSIYIQFAVYVIMIVGLIGIARGLTMLRDTPSKPSNFSRGMIHLFGGIIAVNLVTFLRGIGATVGGDVQSYITTILG